MIEFACIYALNFSQHVDEFVICRKVSKLDLQFFLNYDNSNLYLSALMAFVSQDEITNVMYKFQKECHV